MFDDAILKAANNSLFYLNYLNQSTNYNSSAKFSPRNYFFNLISRNRKNVTGLVKEHNIKTLMKNKEKRFKSKKSFLTYNSSSLLKKMHTNYNIDMYSASLQYSNRIFNKMYGFKSRKVPSHAPIMIDKDIMKALEQKFTKEFFITESNRIRSVNDLQFSFTYYYFLMSEIKERTIEEIFDEIDTDASE